MNETTIYISAHSLSEAQALAQRLTDLGYLVVSTWHAEKPWASDGTTPPPESTHDSLRKKALRNFEAISNADAFVNIVAPDKVTGGKFVELGVALANDVDAYLLGDRYENVMSHES